MFRTLIYPSSRACNYSVELPLWLYCSWFDVCWSFGVVGLEWYPCCSLKHNSNTHRTKKNTTNVVIQQSSRKLLIMDILMSETCWAHKKWNKIESDIKLVFYYSSWFSFILISRWRLSTVEFLALWIWSRAINGITFTYVDPKTPKKEERKCRKVGKYSNNFQCLMSLEQDYSENYQNRSFWNS